MATIRFGIIGLGRMGALHASNLAHRITGATLVAAAVDATHKARLDASGEAPCAVTADPDALVARNDIDALVIASPSSLHAEHIALAIAHKKPVFCEKPLCGSLDDARATAQTVRSAGIPFQIAFQRRYDPSYARARQLIEEGQIGRPEMFRGLSADRIPPVSYLRTSGGLFIDLGIHDIDAARFLMSDEIVAVSAIGTVLVEPELRTFDDFDYGILSLRFQGGGIGVIQNAWRAPYGYDIRAEVHGSDGKVIAEVDADAPATLYRDGGKAQSRYVEFTARFADAYAAELQAFVDCLHSGVSPTPDVEDGLIAMEVAHAATESAHKDGSWLTLPALTAPHSPKA
jgi:inositol 2-dehydrogenase